MAAERVPEPLITQGTVGTCSWTQCDAYQHFIYTSSPIHTHTHTHAHTHTHTHAHTHTHTCTHTHTHTCTHTHTHTCTHTHTHMHTAIDCGLLPPPTNGSIQLPSTTLGSVPTYQCDVGYVLTSPSARECLANGSWSGMNPACQRMHSIVSVVFHYKQCLSTFHTTPIVQALSTFHTTPIVQALIPSESDLVGLYSL